MKLHLVGGFLGSGKTTTIVQAAKILMDQGQRVGIITNDQGRYLVDSAFVRLSSIPSVEVTGGCFCCNYQDLDEQLARLIADARPDVIFAESVGSCADIVATVVKPLLTLGAEEVHPTSFSVMADARLLRRRMQGQEMPFSEDVVYLFDKQIEEAGLLVINKADLLSEEQLAVVQAEAGRRFPEKTILIQSALSQAGILPWLDRIQVEPIRLPEEALAIDYQRYGAGEARLAWLDAEVTLNFPPHQGRQMVRQIMTRLLEALNRREAGIGHLKFFLQQPGLQNGTLRSTGAKISFVAVTENGWEAQIPKIEGESALLLVNARVEMPAETLRSLLHEVLAKSGLVYTVRSEDAFHPAQPKQYHRAL